MFLALLQDDVVYKSLTARDKVDLWEQGLCPGLQVSDQLLQLMLLVLPTAPAIRSSGLLLSALSSAILASDAVAAA